jgi:glycosyltransferase involved in cell wall biosynthesis
MNKILPGSPSVTIGIPLYRSGRFLDTIIANIEAMPKAGIEILISDRHCYDDAIDKLIIRYGNDPRIRFFKAQDELDWVGNINFLLNEARGEFWRFLPHDDLSPAGSLESLLSALVTDKDAILAYGKIKAVDLNDQCLPRLEDHWNPQPKNAEDGWTLGIALEMCWNFHHFDGAFQGLVRRKVLVDNQLLIRSALGQVFPERGWQFALCLLGRFHFVPEALYIKRYYPDSTHKKWKITHFNYYSIAWVYSTYLWDLLGPLPARWYSIWDVWFNTLRLAWRGFAHNNGKQFSYNAAPDFLSWLINRIFPQNKSWVKNLNKSRKRKIDSLRIMSLPQKRH